VAQIKVVEFSDSLEGSGLTPQEIERKLSEYRLQLVQRLQPTSGASAAAAHDEPRRGRDEQQSPERDRKRQRSPSPNDGYGQDGVKRRKGE